MKNSIIVLLLFITLSWLLANCSNAPSSSHESNSDRVPKQEKQAVPIPAPPVATDTPATASTPIESSADKNKLPFENFKPKKFNQALADEGAVLFTACQMCHDLDNRMIGPPLRGVTARREPTWVVNMILAPEIMIRTDSIAKALFDEYKSPMTPLNITKEDAIALYEYLREEDGAR